jgi:hypothetical protein
LDASHHSLSPPIVADALGYFGARPIESVERYRDVFVELGSVVCCAVAKAIDDLSRDAIGIPFRLDEQRRNGADEDSLFNETFAVPCNVAGDFAAARLVANMDGVLEIELFDDLVHIVRIRIHIVTDGGLSRAAVAAMIMRNDPIALGQEEHHLSVPVVG